MEQHPDSYYYHSTHEVPDHPVLSADRETDVCVVGAGFTGLSCALHLARLGREVVVLEANRVAWGASGRNGGQLCSGQRKDVFELEKMFGKRRAAELWRIGEDAKTLCRNLIAEYRIDCDLKDGIIHPTHKRKYSEAYQRFADELRKRYHYTHVRPVTDVEMKQQVGSETYFGGYLDMGAGHLHPLNYALGLAAAAKSAGAEIFEGTRAERYSEGERIEVRTRQGAVRCRQLVLACNGYLGNLDARLAGKIMPLNNFVLATEPLGEERARSLIRDDVAVADSRFVINYFRLSADKRLLFGGGETYGRRFPADIKSFVRKCMLKVFPQMDDVVIDYAWGGTLAITLNRLPHVGRLGSNIYFSLGYSGQGVALGTLCGRLVAEEIVDGNEDFRIMSEIPTKSFPGGTWLRTPGMAAGMLYYTVRDRF